LIVSPPIISSKKKKEPTPIAMTIIAIITTGFTNFLSYSIILGIHGECCAKLLETLLSVWIK